VFNRGYYNDRNLTTIPYKQSSAMNQYPTYVLSFIVIVIVFFAISKPAHAETEKWLGEFQDWTAVSFSEDGRHGCYVVSKPKKEEGNYTQRGPAYVLVTRRQGASTDVVSFQAGYRFKEESDVQVTIDGKSWKLFTDSEIAWAYDGEDKMLVDRMQQGKRMVVVGTSWRGTETKDTYSLFGFTKAYTEILDACR